MISNTKNKNLKYMFSMILGLIFLFVALTCINMLIKNFKLSVLSDIIYIIIILLFSSGGLSLLLNPFKKLKWVDKMMNKLDKIFNLTMYLFQGYYLLFGILVTLTLTVILPIKLSGIFAEHSVQIFKSLLYILWVISSIILLNFSERIGNWIFNLVGKTTSLQFGKEMIATIFGTNYIRAGFYTLTTIIYFISNVETFSENQMSITLLFNSFLPNSNIDSWRNIKDVVREVLLTVTVIDSLFSLLPHIKNKQSRDI